MFRSIIPREKVFFDNFERICGFMTEAAKHLRTMLEKGEPNDEAAHRIKKLEREADELIHRSIETLHKTFVTPLDRQDILRLIRGYNAMLAFVIFIISVALIFYSQRWEAFPFQQPTPLPERSSELVRLPSCRPSDGGSLQISYLPGFQQFQQLQ